MAKKTWAKLIIAVLLVVVIAAGIYLRWRPSGQGSGSPAGWGQGDLKTSERLYYSSRIDGIIGNWQQTAGQADIDKDGRLKESYRTFLVIDTDRQAIWIEDNGQIQKDNYTEFPAGMSCTLYHSNPQGNTKLSGRTILKIRGPYSRRQTPEQLCLVGTGRGAGYISLHFNSSSRGRDYGSGRFNPQPYQSGSSSKTENLYGSLVVADAEYRQYLSSLADSTLSQPDEQNAQIQIIQDIEKNKAAWQKVGKLLYIEVERQVSDAGFKLRDLKVEAGPDFSAAHAEILAHTDNFLRNIFGGYSSIWGYLKIDYLGNDIWYVKNAAHPQRPVPSRRQLDLEFLVGPTADIPDSQHSRLIEMGRKIQQPTPIPPSKWKAALPNGATVEFIGICENPSAGKQWWGPDGSPIGYAPYFNAEPYDRPRTDRNLYELAWRIKWPGSSSSTGTQTSFEGCIGSYDREIRDRYGNRLIGNLNAHGCAFDKSREKTTLKIGLKTGDQDFQHVTFKNISLVPGKNQGFSIELDDQ